MRSASEIQPFDETTESVLPWMLRIGFAGCYIGHGAFGIITKAAWVPYFAVGGIGEPLAWRLMPFIGTMDIVMGILVLVWPCRALFAWAAAWTLWTALLRPLASEPVWEFVERAGNYGVPIALLVVAGWRAPWLARLPSAWHGFTSAARNRLAWTLRLTTTMLLAGHAGLGLLVRKADLAHHYAALGLGDPAALVPVVGAFEFFLAALVLLRPRPALLVGVCLWKVAAESLFPLSGSPIWELIERFGSYTAPLALARMLYTHSEAAMRSVQCLEPIVLGAGTSGLKAKPPLKREANRSTG